MSNGENKLSPEGTALGGSAIPKPATSWNLWYATWGCKHEVTYLLEGNAFGKFESDAVKLRHNEWDKKHG